MRSSGGSGGRRLKTLKEQIAKLDQLPDLGRLMAAASRAAVHAAA